VELDEDSTNPYQKWHYSWLWLDYFEKVFSLTDENESQILQYSLLGFDFNVSKLSFPIFQ
jgi:hypothetical protein